MPAPSIGGGHIPTDPGTGNMWGSDGAGNAAATAGVYTASVTLTAPQVLALHTTPVTVVAAPGAGIALIPIGVTWNYTYGGTAYTDGGGDIFLCSGTGVGATTWFGFVTNANWWTTASSKVAINNAGGSSQDAPYPVTSVVNQPLTVSQSVASPTLGNGTVTVTVAYRRIAVS